MLWADLVAAVAGHNGPMIVAGDRPTVSKVASGVSYLGVVGPCLLGTPVDHTAGLVDSLLLTH